MKRFKATFKTWAYVGAPMKLETRIVEAYDTQHVKNLIQKNDDIIIEIKQIEKFFLVEIAVVSLLLEIRIYNLVEPGSCNSRIFCSHEGI
mgnify:CR=1 FL=1